MTTMTTTRTVLVACSGGLPTTLGINTNDCFGKLNGQTCTVSCAVTYTGGDEEKNSLLQSFQAARRLSGVLLQRCQR